ncbi:DsbA family protein [Tumidithrix elongata RA019]|uniref:2-hydroxychromene-2-carboxylate isomerase n=1 Tax=Tumidithrix elongata BACA0141 TaxID=2716417 RepID=A0AAW9PTJ4_9CYAN|nr:DsbA family protein [Tumidithrix elongata RA019]
MTISVDFYYGLGSRYSYLAASQIPRIEASLDCQFVWKPLFSGALIERWQRNPFVDRPVSGQYDWVYRQRDAERWADYYGIPFHEPQLRAIAPKDLALATLAAAQFGLLKNYSQLLFNAIFAEGRAIDREMLAQFGVSLGISEIDFYETLRSPSLQFQLEQITQEAFQRGAFGVPTFFVGTEMFWGNDRLVLLEQHLSKNDR